MSVAAGVGGRGLAVAGGCVLGIGIGVGDAVGGVAVVLADATGTIVVATTPGLVIESSVAAGAAAEFVSPQATARRTIAMRPARNV
jgi:hypothetical protein